MNVNNLTKQELLNSIREHYTNKWNMDNKRENAKLRIYKPSTIPWSKKYIQNF